MNSIAALLSQQYFYIFVHEMGHAVAIKTLKKDEKPKVTIYLEDDDARFFTLQGKTLGDTGNAGKLTPDWKENIVLASGPLSECVVSGAQCLAVAALGRYLPSIVAKSMYFSVAVPFITRSINSLDCFNEGTDFSKIRKVSYRDLAIATGLIAGNVFVVIAVSRKINPEVSLF